MTNEQLHAEIERLEWSIVICDRHGEMSAATPLRAQLRAFEKELQYRAG